LKEGYAKKRHRLDSLKFELNFQYHSSSATPARPLFVIKNYAPGIVFYLHRPLHLFHVFLSKKKSACRLKSEGGQATFSLSREN